MVLKPFTWFKRHNERERERERERCVDFLELIENDYHFLERVTTDDEFWMFQQDQEPRPEYEMGHFNFSRT